MKLKTLAPWNKSCGQPRQHIKKQRHYLADKSLSSQSYDCSSSYVWMWEWYYKESWALMNWCFWTVLLEKTLESPLDCREIKPVKRKGNQCWIFIGRTHAEAETPILWLHDAKNQLIGKDPDAGKDWRQEEKGLTEDNMFGWHHRLDGHEFEQALGYGDGQRSLACCSLWGHKESDTTEWLNWTINGLLNLKSCPVEEVSKKLHFNFVLNFLIISYNLCFSGNIINFSENPLIWELQKVIELYSLKSRAIVLPDSVMH